MWWKENKDACEMCVCQTHSVIGPVFSRDPLSKPASPTPPWIRLIFVLKGKKIVPEGFIGQSSGCVSLDTATW